MIYILKYRGEWETSVCWAGGRSTEYGTMNAQVKKRRMGRRIQGAGVSGLRYATKGRIPLKDKPWEKEYRHEKGENWIVGNGQSRNHKV